MTPQHRNRLTREAIDRIAGHVEKLTGKPVPLVLSGRADSRNARDLATVADALDAHFAPAPAAEV
jgi:hypothetical protein